MWQYLLKSWLMGALKEQVRQAATEGLAQAARSSTDPASPSPAVDPASLWTRCDVGVITELPAELAGIEDRLAGTLRIAPLPFPAKKPGADAHGKPPALRLVQGGLAGRGVVALAAGGEPGMARTAVDLLIDAHQPAWIISAGFATGLSPELEPLDLLLASQCVARGGDRLTISEGALPAGVSDAVRAGLHSGSLLSTLDPPGSAERRTELGSQRGCLAQDRLGYEVASACRQRAVPCLVVRVVREAWDERLPAHFRNQEQGASTAQWLGTLAGAATRGSHTVRAWWAWQERTLKAGDRLARAVAELVAAVPPGPGSPMPDEAK